MSIKFDQTCWTQQGVNFVIKHIPGEIRWGVLSPEESAFESEPSQKERIKVIRSGDVEKIRSLKCIKSIDLTTEPIDQWDFNVPNDGFDVPVTAYCLTQKKEQTDKPAVLYFHGGGWCYGSRSVVENPCRLLAQYAGAVVFSTDYRLAPEHKYPIGLNDCHAVLQYVYQHADEMGIDKNSIIVSGDSAGGNLSAALSHRDRNEKAGMIRMQALIYPAVAISDPEGLPGYHFSLEDYCFDDAQPQIVKAIMGLKYACETTLNKYVQDESNLKLPDVSPLFDEDFSGLPQTLIICAEYDFLTQQSKCYARKLAAAGVPVSFITYRGIKHAFIDKCGVFPQAEDCIREMADAILAL